MCFNATTSAITFTIGSLSSIYLFYNGSQTNDKSNKLFSLIVMLISLMQLIEYFLWKNQKCNLTNHIFSILIIVVLALQPNLGLGYCYYLYKDEINIPFTAFLIYFLTSTIYFVWIFPGLISQRLCSTTTKKSCRLHWAPITKLWENKVYFLLGSILYFIPVFASIFPSIFSKKSFKLKYHLRYLFLPVTLILTLLYLLIKKDTEYADVFGSIWCFSAVFLGPLCILETIQSKV